MKLSMTSLLLLQTFNNFILCSSTVSQYFYYSTYQILFHFFMFFSPTRLEYHLFAQLSIEEP